MHVGAGGATLGLALAPAGCGCANAVPVAPNASANVIANFDTENFMLQRYHTGCRGGRARSRPFVTWLQQRNPLDLRYGTYMNFALDSEQEMIVATVRRFAEREVRGWAAAADASGVLPPKLTAAGTELGFFVDAVPASAGGMLDGAYNHLTRALRSYELGRGCAATAALFESNVEPALAVAQWGSPALQTALFTALANGAIATTVRDSTGTLQVHSDASGNGIRISGRIGPAPGLATALHVLLLAECEGAPIVAVLDLAASQARVEAITPSGWRYASWGVATLEHAHINADHVLGRGPLGQFATDWILAWHRTSLAARAAGVAAAAMEHAERYGNERFQFGQPVGNFESIIRLREDSQTAAASARLNALYAAWACDQLGATPSVTAVHNAWDAASRARIIACDAVSKATIDAVQIFGGYGFVADYPVEKLMRDARAFEALLGDERLERTLRARNLVNTALVHT